MTLVAVSLFIFRRREPGRALAYRVPLYPITPLIFIATCLYMLYSSLVYAGSSAWVGAAVLLAGTPLLLLNRNAAPAGEAAE
jgi:amino acid transporter